MHSVLIVDDDTALRRTVASWIDSFGYAVQEARTVEDALIAMEREPSSIALCDACMAGKDGVWLAWRMRAVTPSVDIVQYFLDAASGDVLLEYSDRQSQSAVGRAVTTCLRRFTPTPPRRSRRPRRQAPRGRRVAALRRR